MPPIPTPPGSGKSLLACTIAGEAGRDVGGGIHRGLGGNVIDCFAVCSGSEFVDTYVGRGAARMRGLFWYIREEAMHNFVRRRGRGRIGRNARSVVAGGENGLLSRTLSGVSDGMAGILEGMRLLSGAIDATSGKEDEDCTSNHGHHLHMRSTQSRNDVILDGIIVVHRGWLRREGANFESSTT